jgi:P-type E1-E2 ATPase
VKRDKVEEDLVFVGLVGIKDPPRDGVIESIEICERAGIAVHMLTGTPPFPLCCTAQGQAADLQLFR